MLRIGKPYLEQAGDETRLCAEVELPSGKATAWFGVENEFAQFLTQDRADAFVLGFFPLAARLGEDILCDGAVTYRLLYQLNHYLAPSLAANVTHCRSIQLKAQAAERIESAGKAVGTGWTGGVDSLYTLLCYTSEDEQDFRLTHLLVANSGAFEGEDIEGNYKKALSDAKKAAKELGLEAVGINSNLHLLLCEKYLSVAAFRLPAAVLAVQKLFKVFLNSAGYEFASFSMLPENSAYYELLTLWCFETDCTVFYSSGGDASRIQKLRELSDFPEAQRRLHTCIYLGDTNCGKCGKCVRTQAALYALGTLDRFSAVYDLEKFYGNLNWMLADILLQKDSRHYGETAALLEEKKMITPEVRRTLRTMKAAKKTEEQRRLLSQEEK